MVIAAGRLDEVVPLEPAAMPGRTVIQWDKDDCADLGLIKVDLLGLGMLAALEEAIPMIRDHEGVDIDLAHLPPDDDPTVYEMIRRADTVGVFQIESRAQMASLPRNRPERFYDLVVQVAIIRPGPDRRQHDQPLPRAPPGPRAGQLPPPQPRADPRSAPSACRSSRSSCCASPWSRPASPAARPRSCAAPWASSARASGWRPSSASCAPA